MSGAEAFLSRVVGALQQAGIPYMLAGSFASSHHGAPRATQDIDIVVDPTFDSLDRFLELLRKARPFSKNELARRTPAMVLGVSVFVATAEDTILAKLEWAQLGESERQLRDVRALLDASIRALR